MNEDECNVLHEKQNVINENIETEGVVCGLVHQKFCCVRSCFRDTLGEGLGSI